MLRYAFWSCLLSFALSISIPYTPIVALDYISLRGAYSTTYNLTSFRKIPFGASTAGKNRFRAPQPPTIHNGTYDSDQSFDMCVQRTVNGSEDCLYLGLYSRPWDGKTLRPVLLTFYGGGFVQGSASFTLPPSGFPVLNVSSINDYVVVYSNYRTNVFGFLAGKKVKEHEDVDLNAGLLDQRAALEWIQKYIHHFGGDKTNVTIWGQSAGGGSVVAQAIAQGNRGKKLFTKAMASSPFWPKTYRYDDAFNEENYEFIVGDVGCGGAEDEIACLKQVDVQKLRDANLQVTAKNIYTTSSYTWGPVIDGDFLSKGLVDVINSGELNADTILSSYNLHEGENFIPPGFANSSGNAGFNSSASSFDSWLKGFLLWFSEEELEAVRNAYPSNGTAEEIKYYSTYERAGLLYRDLVLACPAYWLSKTAEHGWLIEYTINPAKHASDTVYWNTINPVQVSDPLTYEGYAGAMASFVQTGNPNAHKVTNASIPEVPLVNSGAGEQFLVTSKGLGAGSVSQLNQRCYFWLNHGHKVPI
ncbi:putative carboxylesterase [Polyplosphaeria fusca]|uniref:Carboxylic ester hydrolase n=1 Tax=Polyplosphaeria fusca TaxID=682080 RepID=A0A9P4R962_9PLEO|nr:putative carboxylesterase [Polyplosphaeria fusca]